MIAAETFLHVCGYRSIRYGYDCCVATMTCLGCVGTALPPVQHVWNMFGIVRFYSDMSRRSVRTHDTDIPSNDVRVATQYHTPDIPHTRCPSEKAVRTHFIHAPGIVLCRAKTLRTYTRHDVWGGNIVHTYPRHYDGVATQTDNIS